MYGIYPTALSPAVLTEFVPQLLAALSLYMLSYEFIYYWCAPAHGPARTRSTDPSRYQPTTPTLPPRRILAAPSPHPRRTLGAPSPRPRRALGAPSAQVAPRDARG